MTHLCSQLYRDPHHEGWNEYDLETIHVEELRFLCRVMGIPDYGNRQVLIVRLLSLRICRLDLSKFGSDYQALQDVCAAFKKDRLHWMCREANLWKSGTKIQMAQVLLSWRNKARLAGQKYLAECDAFTRAKGVQLTLPLPE